MLTPLALGLALAVLLPWLAVLLRAGQPWRLQPREGDLPAAPPPPRWPAVRIVVPARNEAHSLPATLPALLAQDYPGDYEVVLVDDRSVDGTTETALAIGATAGARARLRVLRGAPLPDGWVGKPWALQQGVAADHRVQPAWLLFTDADILHAERSLARLVAEAEHGGLALDSRMARLRCESAAERLLVPAYLYFFNLLYPMPRANDPRDRLAAAAGGCVLVQAEALRAAGGLERIRDRIIDDIALAGLIKRGGGRTFLALAERDVLSTRVYDEGDARAWRGDVWRMVKRSAYTQLRHSPLLLALTLLMLADVFLLPVVLLPLAAPVLAGGADHLALPAGAALLACAAMAFSYLPTLRYFALPRWRVLTLPWAALLFGCMTLDSALAERLGRARGWR